MAPLAPLVTLIGSFIGLAQEARRYRQIHKNAAATENVSSRTAENSTKRADGKLNLPSISEEICPKSSLSDSITQEVPALLNDHRDIDEEEPLLKPTAQEDPVCLIFHEETDEKHASLNPPTQKENVGLVDTNRNKTGEKESDGLVRLSDYQRSTTSGTKRGTHLSDPVILPQRRPRWKNHGFIRAYAPALRECDIDEEQFLDFTDNFHQTAKVMHPITSVSSEPNPLRSHDSPKGQSLILNSFAAFSMVSCYRAYNHSYRYYLYYIPSLVPCGDDGPRSYRSWTRNTCKTSVSNPFNCQLRILSTRYPEPMHP